MEKKDDKDQIISSISTANYDDLSKFSVIFFEKSKTIVYYELVH